MTKFAWIAAAAMIGASGGAFAQSYVGLGVGSAKFNIDCTGATNCSGTDTGSKFFGGYRFTPNVAAELGYMNFGRGKGTVGGSTLTIRNSSIGIGVAFSGNFAQDWSGVARLGLARVKTEGSVSGVAGNVSQTSSNAYGGLGVGYAVNKAVSLDAALDFTKGKLVGQSGNLRLFSVGATFNF